MNLRYLGAVVALGLAAAVLADEKKEQPITPKDGVIKLFNGKDLAGLYTYLGPPKKGEKPLGKNNDPNKVFTVHDDMIHVSGEGNGYVATEKEYENYHLSVEYKWGKNTFGSKYVRNSGVLLHGAGPDGGAGGTWMASIECQLAQGCVGDLIVIGSKDVPVSIKAETVLGPDKRPRWKKGGEERTFTKGQLWWSLHDPEYKELIDTRGKDDVESKLGEWTKVECLCDGKRITLIVNGATVNECYDANPSAGKILLQSEGFEMYFRNFELRPLKKK